MGCLQAGGHIIRTYLKIALKRTTSEEKLDDPAPHIMA